VLFGGGTGLVLMEIVILCIVYLQDQDTWRDADEKEVDVFGAIVISILTLKHI